jgi:hypothetical protein
MLYFTMVTFIIMLQQLSKVNIVVNVGVFKRAIVIFWGMASCIVIAITFIGSLTYGHWAYIPLGLTINRASTC